MPGKDNTVADAMSKYAYPASSSREDVSFHGSSQAEAEVNKLIEREIAEGNMLGMIRLGRTNTVGCVEKGFQRSITQGQFVIMDPKDLARPVVYHIPVITRSGAGEESSAPQEEDVPMDSPPPASRTRSRVPPPGRGAAPLPQQSRRSTRGRRLARAPVPRQQSDSDASESPPLMARRRACTAPSSSPGIPGGSFPTGELSGQGSTLQTEASAKAEAGPILMSNSPPPLLPC
jgi:hypothetical protein